MKRMPPLVREMTAFDQALINISARTGCGMLLDAWPDQKNAELGYFVSA